MVNATPSNGVIISKNAKVTYHKGTKTGDTATVATFNNIKKEDETSANIKVKKTFTPEVKTSGIMIQSEDARQGAEKLYAMLSDKNII